MLIREKAKQAGFDERTRVAADEPTFAWETLHTLVHSYSLLATKKLIELDLRNQLPTKTASTLLSHAIHTLTTDTVLLLETNKLDEKITKTDWYHAVEKIGVVVTIWPIPIEQFPQWLIHHAKKDYALTLQPAAAHLIATAYEGNVTAALQTLEKLSLLYPEKIIDATSAHLLLRDESHYSIFDLLDPLLLGDIKRVLHILHQLQEEKVEPVLILWAITRELRLLATLAQKLASGISFDKLCQQHRIFTKRQPAIRRFLSTFKQADCWHYLDEAAKVDSIMKGAKVSDPWQALERLCLSLGTQAQEGQHLSWLQPLAQGQQ